MARPTIGIDIGYGDTKTHTGKASCIFPTALSSAPPDETFSLIETYSVAGKEFVVGEDAVTQRLHLADTKQASFFLSDAWFAVLGRALRASSFDPEGANIIIGLPPGELTKPKIEKIRKEFRTRSILHTKTGSSYFFNDTFVDVIPQGAGIFYSYIMADDDAYDEKNIAVVDIGHYTLDMVYFTKGGRYVESVKESINLGASYVLGRIAEEFQRKYNQRLQYPQILKLLNNGKLSDGKTEYSLDNIDHILGLYAEKLNNHVDAFLEKLAMDVDIALVAGGGARILKKFPPNHCILIATQPELSNAIGYWYYGSHIEV